jgi:hypothetical protein
MSSGILRRVDWSTATVPLSWRSRSRVLKSTRCNIPDDSNVYIQKCSQAFQGHLNARRMSEVGYFEGSLAH